MSNILKSLSSPLTTTFLNAFVFRVTGDLLGVALYNIGQFIGLPLAFYINGLLLRKFRTSVLLARGAIASAVTTAVFVLVGDHVTLLSVFLFGFLWGIGNGFYWSNRNYLEFQETSFDVRQYFYGAVSAIGSISSVVIPVLAGVFIATLARSGVTLTHAYWAIFGCSFLLMFYCGLIISKGEFISPSPERISRLSSGSIFSARRLLSFACGFTDGAFSFIPILIILSFLGGEEVLGTLTATVSLLTALAMYIYGRRIRVERANTTIIISAFVFLGATLLLIFANKFAIIAYVVLTGISVSFFSLAASPVMLELSDKEMQGRNELRYSFIFDNELFLNAGRIASICILLLSISVFPKTLGLVYGSISFVITCCILVLVYVRKSGKAEVSV